MGAGILPCTIHKGQLYFLFGKENKYEDSAPGFSDFGGGSDKDDANLLETAIREAGEEFTGFLGSDSDLRKILQKYGTYNIDHKDPNHSLYRMHIFPMKYDALLPFYFNNNHKFIESRLDPSIMKKTKIFEKVEIKWVSINEIPKMKDKFRCYFKHIIDILLHQKKDIKKFMEKSLRKKLTRHKKYNNKNKTRRI